MRMAETNQEGTEHNSGWIKERDNFFILLIISHLVGIIKTNKIIFITKLSLENGALE